MKKKDYILMFSLFIIAILVSSLVSVAAAGHLFDSNEVVYDNTNSGMSSSNVKDAVDELYAAASDYSNINSRVTTLESNYNYRFKNNPTSYFDGDNLFIAGNASTTADGSWIEFMSNGVDKLGIGTFNDGTSIITTKSTNGSLGGTALNISANPLKINNTKFEDMFVLETKQGPQKTISANGIDAVQVDISKTGYKIIMYNCHTRGTGYNSIANGSCFLSGTTVTYVMRNVTTSAATVNPNIAVLYVKTTA